MNNNKNRDLIRDRYFVSKSLFCVGIQFYQTVFLMPYNWFLSKTSAVILKLRNWKMRIHSDLQSEALTNCWIVFKDENMILRFFPASAKACVRKEKGGGMVRFCVISVRCVKAQQLLNSDRQLKTSYVWLKELGRIFLRQVDNGLHSQKLSTHLQRYGTTGAIQLQTLHQWPKQNTSRRFAFVQV